MLAGVLGVELLPDELEVLGVLGLLGLLESGVVDDEESEEPLEVSEVEGVDVAVPDDVEEVPPRLSFL